MKANYDPQWCGLLLSLKSLYKQKAYADVPFQSQQCRELLSMQETLSGWLDVNILIK